MSFSPETKGRSWFVTVQLANMKKAGMKKEQYKNPEIVAERFLNEWEKSGKGRIGAAAVCESSQGLYHMHMVCYGNTTTLQKVSDVLFQSHVEPVKGKAQLLQYITKEGKYAEKGEKVLYTKNLEVIEQNQGRRNDLDEIGELLKNGCTPEEIFETSFRFRKYEKMVKAEYLARKIRETPPVKKMWNEYHWGKSGTGKTYTYIKLCEKYSPDEVYLCSDYANSGASGGGFDFYGNTAAKIVVLDEFRGNIPYSQFLSMLDVYSRNQQHCRYQNVYNLWTSVIVCSIYPPEKAYSFMVDDTEKSVDSIQQLLRRLNRIVYHYINKDGKYRAFEMPACDYVSAADMMQKAAEYEKHADELEVLAGAAQEESLETPEEFMKKWGAVKVKG